MPNSLFAIVTLIVSIVKFNFVIAKSNFTFAKFNFIIKGNSLHPDEWEDVRKV